jgi:nickel-dependent lactate racemase
VTVEVNSALKEFSRVILTGGVTFHYFAGFTGGRKSICPGLASAKTIEATHMLALDFETWWSQSRRGQPDDSTEMRFMKSVNALRRWSRPRFSINTIVDERKNALKVFCGDWRLAHRAACDYYLEQNSFAVPLSARSYR